jgi:hypothetical protein
VERHVEIECPSSQAPPIGYGPVLRTRISIIMVSRKAELDVVTRKLTNDVRQVFDEVVLEIIVIIPGTVPLLAVRIDVGNDPPLVSLECGISRRHRREIRDEVPQQPRAHGLVCVTSGDEAHAALAAP